MPVVSASNVPYSPAPSVEPEVRAPQAFQDVRAPAAAFGGDIGAAESQLGRGIERGGDVLAEAALRKQGLLNQIAADEATNHSQDFVNKTLRGDPTTGQVGFFQLHGADAVKEWPNVQNAIDKHIAETSGQFTNPRQKLLYDSETRRMRGYWMQEIGTHYDREFQQYGIATAKAGVDNGLTRIAQAIARDDDAAAQIAIGDTMRSAMKELQARGEANNPDIVNETLQKIRGQAVKVKAEGIAEKNPLAAVEFVRNNIDALHGDEANQLLSRYRARATALQADVDNGFAPPPKKMGESDNYDGAHMIKHVALEEERISFARSYARSKGVNPDSVEATISGEGRKVYVGDNGTSFGDFQLHVGDGMGDAALAAGIDIRDPKTWKEQTKFAIDQMAANKDKGADWFANQWHGAPRWAAEQFATPDIKAPPQAPVQLVANGPDTLVPDVKPLPKINRPLPPNVRDEIPDNQLPGMADQIERLAKTIPADETERFNAGVERARKVLNKQYQDQQRQFRLHQEQTKAQSEVQKNKYLERFAATSMNPPTEDEILKDQFLLPGDKENLIGFGRREGKDDPLPAQDKANTIDLLDRMRLPYGDEKKVYDDKPLFDAYKNKQIGKASFDWLNNKLKNEQNELGQTIKQTKDNFMRAVAHQVEGARSPSGELLDGDAGIRRANFELLVDKMVSDAIHGGKDPTQLFIPSDSKDPYSSPLGKLLKMPEFQPKMKQMMQGGANQAGGTTPAKQYKTQEDVKAGALRGEITRDKARKILIENFGMKPPVETPIR